jgi:TonB-linked SusC/RagA family outer membrane protein
VRIVRLLGVFALAAAASAFDAGGLAAQQGTITGRVTDAGSGQPVSSAQVRVVGTNLGSLTNQEGVYTLRGVPLGTATVRVLTIGYGEASRQVTVAAGQPATLNFSLQATSIMLAPVVATATGEQRRIEIGNAVAQVQAENVVETSAVSNMADLLTARAAGVTVIPGTQTGAGVRVRVRGTSSLSLTNNPIYVIDGVRMESSTGSSSVSVGGTTPSRVGDLNPEEIQSIEIVRGPSAATLYGTDAANGVIVITTKRGIAGPPRWTYYTEQTAITDRNDYPTAYRGWRTGTTTTTNSTSGNTVQCVLTEVASGACTQDSVTAFNPVRDRETTPFGTGYRQQHGLQVRGGSEALRYFLHAEWEDEDGVTEVPEFERRYLRSRGLSLLPEQENPNHLGRLTARANFNIGLPNSGDIAINAGYTSQDLRLPMSDDAGTAGIAANIYGGPGFKYNTNAAGDTLWGWREFTPRNVYQYVTTQSIERVITSVTTSLPLRDWLTVRGNAGLDFTHRLDTQLCRFAECTGPADRLGYKIDNRSNFFLYTVDAAATATRQLSGSVESQTAVGVQYYRNVFDRNGTRGNRLPPGATTVTAAPAGLKEADEATNETRTLGAYVEERLNVRDRLFLTGAVRSDRNSAFGADFETVFYPKLSASWVISEEPFFPRPGFLDQFRLRAAYGASGVQPGTIDALPYFATTTVVGEAGEATGVVFSALGNSDLKPERSTEFEAGVDGTFWSSRITTELTYYHKVSKDALIERVLPPSVGTGLTVRFENLGEVRNSGWEALVNARLVDGPSFGWDLTFNGSANRNRLVSLGGVPEIVVSSTLQHREGYPLNGWWTRQLMGYEDKDGDGIIEFNADSTLSEITVSAVPQFHGYSAPPRELAVTSGFDFWQRRLRVSAMVDYKGGHLIYNNTERIRCASRNNCEGLVSPDATLEEQARVVAVRQHPSRTVSGFLEEGDFLRFRELSLSFDAPERWASRVLGSRQVTATLAARNLGILWTKFSGVDPEAFGTTGDAPSTFQAFAPPTYFTFRLTLGL